MDLISQSATITRQQLILNVSWESHLAWDILNKNGKLSIHQLQVLARKDSNNLKLQNYFWEEKSAIKTMYGIKSYQGVSKEKSFSFPGFLSVNI